MKKAHAEHNERACDLLLKSGKFNDWVITTAFYSALHFTQNEIFPVVEDSVKYETFDEYYNKKYPQRTQRRRPSPHKVTLALVKKYLRPAHPHYSLLYSSCMSARYRNYQVSPKQATAAKLWLLSVKSNCKK